jgi:hypothetical protein
MECLVLSKVQPCREFPKENRNTIVAASSNLPVTDAQMTVMAIKIFMSNSKALMSTEMSFLTDKKLPRTIPVTNTLLTVNSGASSFPAINPKTNIMKEIIVALEY